jgi:nitrate reductase NapE component
LLHNEEEQFTVAVVVVAHVREWCSFGVLVVILYPIPAEHKVVVHVAIAFFNQEVSYGLVLSASLGASRGIVVT